MNNTLLEIKDLYVNAEEKKILKGLNLKINKGEVHVVMGLENLHLQMLFLITQFIQKKMDKYYLKMKT